MDMPAKPSLVPMNSRERVLAALSGQAVDRVPVGPLAVHYCAKLAGISIREYTTNPAALADAVVCYYDRFQPDAVWISADTWVSAEAMGAQVGAEDDHQPFGGIGTPLIRNPADIDRIPAPDPAVQGRYPLMLEALSRVVDRIGKKTFVVACFDQYPFSLAAALMGINEIMMKLREDPPFVRTLMARCAEYVKAYANALANAGADLLSGGDSPAGLVGPGTYAELILPVEAQVIEAIRACTGRPVSLHICGDSKRILPAMRQSGADVLEIDHAVSLADACRAVGRNVALWGNLDPVNVLAWGNSRQVRANAEETCRQAAEFGHTRFVLSSGCTLAMQTPEANLDALVQVAHGTGSRKPLD